MQGHVRTTLFAALFAVSLLLTGCIPVADADVNRDGHVDRHDLNAVRACFKDGARHQPRCETADVNHDGTISDLDLALVRLHLGAVLFESSWPEHRQFLTASDDQGTLYFLYSHEQQIRRWSTIDDHQLLPIELGDDATALVFSATERALLVSLRGGSIVSIPTRAPHIPVEFARTDVPSYRAPLQMLPTREHLIVVAPQSKTWLFSWTGELVAEYTALGERVRGEALAWNEETQKLFQTRAGIYTANEREDFSSYRISGAPGAPSALLPDTPSPYDGHLGRLAPLRVSLSGDSLLAANGMIFDAATLEIETILPIDYTDACWIDETRVATLSREGGDSFVETWHRDGLRLDVSLVSGTPIRIIDCGKRATVVTRLSDGPSTTRVALGLDSDQDGVPTSKDAFPLDRAAAIDSDHDGYPDSWISGGPKPKVETDLVLDAYPHSAACQLQADGDGGVCMAENFDDIGTPNTSLMDGQDVFYFLSGRRAVFRWSASKNRMLDPILFPGESPTALAYCPDSDRIFVAHSSRRIDVLSGPRDSDARPDVDYFATMPSTPRSASALFVRRGKLVAMGIGSTHSEFDPSGKLRSLQFFDFPNAPTTWDARHSRLFAVDSTRLYRASFDPETHRWIETTEASIQSARHVSVSPIGDVLLADSRVLDAHNLTEIETGYSSARSAWLEDGGHLHLDFVSGYSDDEDFRPDASYLVHRNSARNPIARTYLGRLPGVLVATNTRAAVAVTGRSGRYEFHSFRPSNDADADGVPSEIDAFPEDASASVDTDLDGYPDRWNTGYDENDSTQGLKQDAFPEDWICQTASQGRDDDPSVCDYDRYQPTFIAKRGFVDSEGVLYLEKQEEGDAYSARRLDNGLLFRWSIEERRFMNPIVLPRDYVDLTYSPETHRIYYSHDRGRISHMELADQTHRPQEVLRMPEYISNVVAIDPLLFVFNYPTASLFTPTGELTHTISWRESFTDLSWNASFHELYGASFRSLGVAEIDLRTRRFVGLADQPGDTGTSPRGQQIRVSPAGDRFLVNGGNVFAAGTYQLLGSIGTRYQDATFHADRSITTLRGETVRELRRQSDGRLAWTYYAIIEHWDETFELKWRRDVLGSPTGVFAWNDDLVIVTQEDLETRIRVISQADGS